MSPTDQFTPSGGGASDPHDNSAHDPNFHGATDNVEDLPTGGADGTVPKASGGSLSMSTVSTEPNVPNWEEDGNSPLVGSGAQSHKITFASDWDHIHVMVQKFEDENGNADYCRTRLNDITSTDYETRHSDGNSTAGRDSWILAQPNTSHQFNGSFDIISEPSGARIEGPVGELQNSDDLVRGYLNSSSATPLDSLELFGQNGNVGVKARFYGWNGKL